MTESHDVYVGVSICYTNTELALEAVPIAAEANSQRNAESWRFDRTEDRTVDRNLRLIVGYHADELGGDPGVPRSADVGRGLEHNLGRIPPEGQFLVVDVDLAAWELRITTDLAGSVPAFYAATGGKFLVATSLADLVRMGLEPEVNPDFIINFEVVGHSSDDVTFLKGVSLIPPGATLEVGNGGGAVVLTKYGHIQVDERIEPSSRVGLFSLALGDELRRIGALSGPLDTSEPGAVVMLSGGLDSSLIAAHARDPHRFKAVTFDGGRHGEAPRARGVAQEVGLEHEVVPVGYMGVSAAGRDLVTALAGFPCPVPALSVWIVRSLGISGSVYIFGDGADGLDGGYSRNKGTAERLTYLETNLPRFKASTEHVEASRDLYKRTDGSDSTALQALYSFDCNWALRAHHLAPLWLTGQALGVVALCPYVTDDVRAYIERDADAPASLAGKGLLREVLKEFDLAAGDQILQAEKVGLPDAIDGALSELVIWSLGLAPDPEILSVTTTWPEKSRMNLGWWSETIRGLRRIAGDRRPLSS